MVRSADIAACGIQPKRPKKGPKDQSRAVRIALKYVLQLGQSFLDPFPRGRLEDLVATAAQALEFFFQSIDFPFGVEEGLGERATTAPSPMKSTKFASRRSSAFSSVSLSRSVSGMWA